MLKSALVAMGDMMSKKKRFDKALFTENDSPARIAGIRYWSALGYIAAPNYDKYGPDLIVITDSERFYSEVEIKRVWSGETFQYDTLQIPERKQKFAGLDLPCTFMVFNNEQTYAFLCEGDTLIASPLVEVPNKYVHAGEMFYQVPISKLKLVRVPVQ
jgi:hypothetical protein